MPSNGLDMANRLNDAALDVMQELGDAGLGVIEYDARLRTETLFGVPTSVAGSSGIVGSVPTRRRARTYLATGGRDANGVSVRGR